MKNEKNFFNYCRINLGFNWNYLCFFTKRKQAIKQHLIRIYMTKRIFFMSIFQNLKELDELKKQGIITEEEFQVKKMNI